MKAYLILENGKVFEGTSIGAEGETVGEIVFSTTMGSYIEALTDPASYGQILVQTYPLIGNYGMIYSDMESDKVHTKGYVVREMCDVPSNFRCEGTLDSFLKEQGIVGICDIDTREITKIIREEGTMAAKITTSAPDSEKITLPDTKDAVKEVSAKEKYTVGEGEVKIALLDLGTKKSAVNVLASRGASVDVLPCNTKADELSKYDAIYLQTVPEIPTTAKKLQKKSKRYSERSLFLQQDLVISYSL